MKASDYLAFFLAANGIKQVFGLQGGAVVHLFDSVEHQNNLEAIYCHHEQSAALAAVAYAKVSGGLGCAIVTTGPACTNALTGLLAAWQDSTPVIFISGQTRLEHTSYGKPVRQVGSQEFAILDLVRPITKYAQLVESVEQLPEILVKATAAALSGRQGPVWIDFPVNLQWADLPTPSTSLAVDSAKPCKLKVSDHLFDQVIAELSTAARPLVIAGNGVRSSGTVLAFQKFIENLRIPFATSWTAADLLPTNNPLNVGIIGVAGHRGANKAVFSADLLICLGCHLGLTQTSTLTEAYAPHSRKIIVDIDQDQIDNLTIKFNLAIHADLKDFFLKAESKLATLSCKNEWHDTINELRHQNNVEETLTEAEKIGDGITINSNLFNARLTASIPASSLLVVDGGGTALYTGFQSSTLKAGQRIICSSSISAMGTGLPEAVGASFAAERREVYCFIGDGSLMLNLQELQTIRHYGLPVKVIVYNNNGYLAIKHTQKAFLGERYFGTDPKNGVSVPPINGIANCFDIPFLLVSGAAQISDAIDQIINYEGPLIVEVNTPELQSMLFQQGYRTKADGTFEPADLSEMKPFL